MKLNVYLQNNKLTQSEFAKIANIKQPMISRYLTGIETPNIVTLQKIHAATSGQVTAEDFFTDKPQEVKP